MPKQFMVLAFSIAAFSISAVAQTATTTTLAMTSGTSVVTTVASGAVVTLTATVEAGSTPVTPGLVKFCDAAATYCEDIHIVGTAQLTTAGKAIVKFRPGIGSHSYKAMFVGTNNYGASASASVSLTVSGLYPTSTTYSATGGLGGYNVTAAVTGTGLLSPSPSGSVSFVDTSNSNATVGTATLSPGSPALSLLLSDYAQPGYDPVAIVVADFNGDGIPDLAITDAVSTVTVLLGNGDGTFMAAPALTTGTYPVVPGGLVVADFNGDGIPDLAVVNSIVGNNNTGNVTVFLGNGDGTFTTVASNPSVGGGAQSIVAGDFNGDGIPDVATGVYGDGVILLLGNGDGTFVTRFLPFYTQVAPRQIAVGQRLPIAAALRSRTNLGHRHQT